MDRPIALHDAYCPWIESALLNHRRRPWSIPRRRLTNYLLVCSTRGREWLRIEGHDEEVTVPEGASYLLPPRLLVDKGSRGGNRPAMIHFDLRYDPRRERRPPQAAFSDLRGKADWVQPSPEAVWGTALPILLPEILWPAAAEALPRIVAQWQSGEAMAVLRATHRLHGLLLDLLDCVAAEQRPRGHDEEQTIARAERVARSNLGAPFGVAEFARAAGLGRSSFHERYRRLRGISPGAFLRRERMAQAAHLLEQGGLPVAEVGRLVGYPDPAVFSRVFRRSHGRPPSRWG